MSQIPEQEKILEKYLNKMEVSYLPDTEFKTLVIKIINEFRRRVAELKTLTKR